MTASNANKRGLWTGTSAERDALTAADGLLLGDEFWDTNGGKAWWNGSGWQEYVSADAMHVADGFKISDYTGKITSAEAGTTFAIASGARRIMLQSLETTDVTEFAVLAFGTSAANAQANLAKTGVTPNIISNAGAVIYSGDALGAVAPTLILGIPDNATHAALGNGLAGQVQVVMVSQGV